MKNKSLISFCKENPAFGAFFSGVVHSGSNTMHINRLQKLLDKYGMLQDRIICRDSVIFQDSEFIQAFGVLSGVENLNFGPVNLAFGFPKLSKDSAARFVSDLFKFTGSLAVRNGKINLINFPHCFIPEANYKYLYRHIIGPIKGDIFVQRAKIKQLQNSSFSFFKPCKNCRSRIPCYSYTDIQKHPDYEKFLRPRNQDTLVFVGGSLKQNDRTFDNDIVYTSPAEQGDMFGAILEGFKNIVIIDGYFYYKAPCTTFEIMLTLENGINVFGSASIGALRAVELDKYGMNGSGYVYTYLKKQAVKPYHVVAQTYNSDDEPITTPLINIIYFLKRALKKGIIGKEVFQNCLRTAEGIHFTGLTFKYFFKELKAKTGIPQKIRLNLENYLLREGAGSFDIKNKDAKLLLSGFRRRLKERPKDYVVRTFETAKLKYLNILYSKYKCSHDLTLPEDWKFYFENKMENYFPANTRDNRQFAPGETLNRAKYFFKGLDLTAADTSKYDSASSFTINIFFIPFYFLEQIVSSVSGNGNIFIEAVTSACMELVERIPLYKFKIKSLAQNKIGRKPALCQELPQYYNWGINTRRKDSLIKSGGYVTATDIISGKSFFIPHIAALGVFSGTDGNASGNSFAEAILYGIYELIERDVTRIYNRSECVLLQPGLQINKKHILDKRSLVLIRQFREKGLEIVLVNLPNLYNLFCIQCCVFDSGNKIEQHGSVAVRANFESAVFSALHEAYMQYIVNFTGTRDDYLSLFNRHMYLRYQKAEKMFRNKKFIKFDNRAIKFSSINEELDYVIASLKSAGIKRIIVANTSPLEEYALKSVKVIIPGLEISFVYPFKVSSFFKRKAVKTFKLTQDLICRKN